jgi:hypothetical protein
LSDVVPEPPDAFSVPPLSGDGAGPAPVPAPLPAPLPARSHPTHLRYQAWFDGGSRGRGGFGPAGSGWIVRDEQGTTCVRDCRPLGYNVTNNVAEYDGLIGILEYFVGALPRPASCLSISTETPSWLSARCEASGRSGTRA